MDSSRAIAELGLAPRCGVDDAPGQLVEGMGELAGIDTPPLAPKTGGPARLRELWSGVGRYDT
jgi:UDP-glucose 4-epimerase